MPDLLSTTALILGYSPHLGPLIDYRSMHELTESEGWAITDRYIPSRKLLKKDSFFKEAEKDLDQENQRSKTECSGCLVPDLYRQVIMAEGAKETKDRQI